MSKKKEEKDDNASKVKKEVVSTNVEQKWCNNIKIEKDESELNDFLTCWKEFDTRPSKLVIYSSFDESLWDILHDEFGIDECNTQKVTEIIPNSEEVMTNSKFFIKILKGMYLSFIEFDSSEISGLNLFYDHRTITSNMVNDFLQSINKSISLDGVRDESESIFNSLSFNVVSGNFELTPFKSKELNSDIELYYDYKTFKDGKKSIKLINKEKKGLTLFYGSKGRGKTSFMHHLMEKVKKKVIHIPSSMIENVLNNNDFVHFLSQNKNSILLFDDAEIYFTKSPHKNLYVSNLLQMVDGLLSDNLNVNIVLSINLEKDKVDTDLFNCNELLSEVSFNKLSIESANELSNHLGSKKKYKNDVDLLDIIKGKSKNETKSFAI